MTAKQMFDRYFGECPLIAIIRGVTPSEAAQIGRALFEGGIRIIEVPLNSPEPFDSVERIAKELGDEALVGAGTVLTPEDVLRTRDRGGRIIVSPNMDPRVIRTTADAGLVSCPGIFTASEGFAALEAGAHLLKLFPAEAASPKVVKALRAVMPREVRFVIVGGVTRDSMRGWLDAGAVGFGLGSGIYKPGQSADQTLEKARAYVGALGQ